MLPVLAKTVLDVIPSEFSAGQHRKLMEQMSASLTNFGDTEAGASKDCASSREASAVVGYETAGVAEFKVDGVKRLQSNGPGGVT